MAQQTLNDLELGLSFRTKLNDNFTDLYTNKLDSSAYTAADVLAKLLTVDGAGSGVDADTIDGLDSTAFATSAQGALADSALQDGDTVSELTVTDCAANQIILSELNNYYPGLIVVDAVYYDTTKDSDPVWTEKTGSLSYGAEVVPTGDYAGQYATVTAAVTAGWVVEDWFYNTTDKKFYKITATGTPAATEIFRAGSATFPKQVVIVAEASRVIIFDATKDQLEMWMVFNVSTNTLIRNSTIRSISIEESWMVVGGSNGAFIIDFVKDRSAWVTNATTYGGYWDYISTRNQTTNKYLLGTTSNWPYVIVNISTNDTAMTILDSAPIDPVTGLRVPTIAVATAGGVSVIKDDGTVVDITFGTSIKRISITNSRIFIQPTSNALSYGQYPNADTDLATWRDGFYNVSSVPSLLTNTGDLIYDILSGAIASSIGLNLIHENPASPSEGMVAYITKDYNTGWMQGDIKLAALCDTETGNISAPELVTNGTFDTDTDWTKGTGWTISGGFASCDGATNSSIYQNSSLIQGRTYVMQFEITARTSGDVRFEWDSDSITAYFNAVGNYSVYFTPDSSTLNRPLFRTHPTNGFNGSIDNISIKEVTPDRSGNSNHLTINGTLSRAAIGNGEIAAWSGFSASNYLEMSYSSDFDFGTGDFYITGLMNLTTPITNQVLFERHDTAGTGLGRIRLILLTTDQLRFEISDDNGATTDAVTISIVDGSNALYIARVYSGVMYLSVNNESAVSTAISNAASGVSNSSAIISIGGTVLHANPASNMNGLALFRIGAGAPSDDQIAKMYHDELAMLNGMATLDGTSDSVLALSYDKSHDLLHAATSYGRSSFRGLERVESEATTVGTPSAIYGEDGVLLQGGSTGFSSVLPEVNVRSDIKHPVSYDTVLPDDIYYTATGGETDIYLGKGFTAKRVWKNAAPQKKKQGATANDFSIQFNGFEYFIRFASALTASDDIIIERARV